MKKKKWLLRSTNLQNHRFKSLPPSNVTDSFFLLIYLYVSVALATKLYLFRHRRIYPRK